MTPARVLKYLFDPLMSDRVVDADDSELRSDLGESPYTKGT